MEKTYKAVWLEFHKDFKVPKRKEVITNDVVFTKGKKVFVNGKAKVKLNLFEEIDSDKWRTVRADYDISHELTSFLGIPQAENIEALGHIVRKLKDPD